MAELPMGVIAPYVWGEEPIPISGTGEPQTESVDAHVVAAMRRHGIVGCGVCLLHQDRIVYDKGFGYAELPHTPFLPTTATRCGSLAKMVTAQCALLLFDQGKLDLDAPILPILKAIGVVPKPVGDRRMDDRMEQILVRHLMDHTSGMPSVATYTAWRENRNVAEVHGLQQTATSADVASDALGNTTLDSDPGTRYQYANANFVLLARIVEAASNMSFHTFLTEQLTSRFGLPSDALYVSRNQDYPNSPERAANEPTYYQTSAERYVSFLPSELAAGRVWGEAYRGFTTETSDGTAGVACTARGLGTLLANLRSTHPVLSPHAIQELLTPPVHYLITPDFDTTRSSFYSKGLNVRFANGQPYFAHSGMTNHCGGIIGHNAGYQFIAVSNWNHTESPYVDGLLGPPLTEAVALLAGA